MNKAIKQRIGVFAGALALFAVICLTVTFYVHADGDAPVIGITSVTGENIFVDGDNVLISNSNPSVTIIGTVTGSVQSGEDQYVFYDTESNTKTLYSEISSLDKVALTAEGFELPDVSVSSNGKLNLYVVPATDTLGDNSPIVSKTISIKDAPKLKFSSTTTYISNLGDFSGTVSVDFKVNSRNASGLKAALSDADLSDKTDAEIIAVLSGSDVATSSNSLSYSMDIPTDKTLTVYLYNNNYIFDKKEYTIDSSVQLPTIKIKDWENNNIDITGSQPIVIKKSELDNSVNVSSSIAKTLNYGEQLKIEWSDGNSEHGEKTVGYQGYNVYDLSTNINNIPSLSSAGKDYYISFYIFLNNDWRKIGKRTIKIKDYVPEIKWAYGLTVTPVENGTDKILLPQTPTNSNFHGEITDYHASSDKVYVTTQQVNSANYQTFDWDSLQEKTVTQGRAPDHIKTNLDTFNSMYGNTLYYYLVRTGNGSAKKVYELGVWEVDYADITNDWRQNINVFEIPDPADNTVTVSTTFYDTNDSGESKATVSGQYDNYMNGDTVILSQVQYDCTDPSIDTTIAAAINSNAVQTVDANNGRYSFEIDNLTFNDTHTEYPFYLYVRRKRTVNGNDVYKDISLDEVLVKKGHKPVVTGVYPEWEKVSNDRMKIKNLRIEGYDEDTGIKSVELSYMRQDTFRSYAVTLYSWTSNDIDLDFGNNLTLANKDSGIPYDSNHLEMTEEERKTASLTVYDWSGNRITLDRVFALSPQVTFDIPDVTGRANGLYYASNTLDHDVTVTIKSCSDDNASNPEAATTFLESLTIKVNGTEIQPPLTYPAGTKDDTITFNLANLGIAAINQDMYIIDVSAQNSRVNALGNPITNVSNESAIFILDNTMPQIDEILIRDQSVTLNDTSDEYQYFFSDTVNIKVKASDSESGIKSIDYYWEHPNGTKEYDQVDIGITTETTITKSIPRNSSFRGDLYISATDNAGNQIIENGEVKYYRVGGIIIDTDSSHGGETHIAINSDSAGGKDSENRPLYSSAFKATIDVTDNFSGVKSASYTVKKSDSTVLQSGNININNGNADDGSWSIKGSNKNIITGISKTITVDGNEDGMVISVSMTDNANHTSQMDYIFSIDNVKPELSVSFDTSNGDPEFKNYYTHEVKATIVVKDRYFDPSSFSISGTGNKGTLSGWTEKKDTANPNNTTYTAVATFTNDDRYVLSFSCKDKAGNASNKIDATEFVIDTKVPEVKITFDGNNSANGFYSRERKAGILVKDVNFEPSRVSIAGTIPEQGYELSAWNRRDDGYYAVMTMKKDGVYNFSVTATDRAGNKGNIEKVSSFIIDTKKPDIAVEGVEEKSSNRDKVAPVIRLDDLNADKSTIVVELIGAKQGKVDITDWYTISEDGLQITFKDFKREKEVDDLYTLKITGKDKAGNQTTKSIVFSVNRFGSIYYLSDAFQKINDNYVKKVTGIEVTEINPDKIAKKSVVITLSINGKPKTLKEGEDYLITSKESEGDWKTYSYVFKDALFTQDGSYVITLSSEDEAGNVNNNVDKDTELKFGVDATAPIVAPLDFEANTFYSENGKNVSVSVKDNLLLGEVKIYINGIKTEYTVSDEVYSFHIPESNKAQTIQIVATDRAGNETAEIYEGVLVSGNVMVRLFHNKVLLFSIIGGGGIVLIGGTFLGFKVFTR